MTRTTMSNAIISTKVRCLHRWWRGPSLVPLVGRPWRRRLPGCPQSNCGHNGVDRVCVGLVDDDRGMLEQEPKQNNNKAQGGGRLLLLWTGNNILVAVESGPTIKKWAPSNKAVMSDARDDTINTAAVGISTPRNSVFTFFLHSKCSINRLRTS